MLNKAKWSRPKSRPKAEVSELNCTPFGSHCFSCKLCIIYRQHYSPITPSIYILAFCKFTVRTVPVKFRPVTCQNCISRKWETPADLQHSTQAYLFGLMRRFPRMHVELAGSENKRSNKRCSNEQQYSLVNWDGSIVGSKCRRWWEWCICRVVLMVHHESSGFRNAIQLPILSLFFRGGSEVDSELLVCWQGTDYMMR